MAITFPTPPDAAQRIATAGFQQVAQLAESAGSVNLMMLSARGVEISAPHQMHHVPLDDLSARRPFGGATLTGWRYLAMTDSGAVASSEVSADANRQPAGLEQVNMGPYVQSTAAAFADLGENTEVQAGAYEPHLLKIPALCATSCCFANSTATTTSTFHSNLHLTTWKQVAFIVRLNCWTYCRRELGSSWKTIPLSARKRGRDSHSDRGTAANPR